MGIYVDIEKCSRLGLLGRTSVSLNGKKINYVIAAKSGKNGFVEFYPYMKKYQGYCTGLVTRKLRGNVKVSFAHKR